MSKSDNTPDDEKDLFANWVKDVRPLKKGRDKILHKTPQRKISNSGKQDQLEPSENHWSDAHFNEQMLNGADLSQQRKGGIQKQLFKKLKQGKIPIEDRLDLHGNTVNLARSRISHFFHESQFNGLRCVCIIHGKGTHNEHGKAVLKSMVHHWLQQAPEVLAFSSALPSDGGTGAIYVLLKKMRE